MWPGSATNWRSRRSRVGVAPIGHARPIPGRTLRPMGTNEAVLALLAQQDGLITDEQARACGLTGRTVRRRVHDGGWVRPAPGVLLAGGHPWTDRARLRAAGMWVGRRGVLCGSAAAWWHGML